MYISIIKFVKAVADHCSWNVVLLPFITLIGALITISNLKKKNTICITLKCIGWQKDSNLCIHVKPS